MRLPPALDIGLRMLVVLAIWLVLWRDWSVGHDAQLGLSAVVGIAGRLALALIVASWAVRAWRFRGRSDD